MTVGIRTNADDSLLHIVRTSYLLIIPVFVV